MSTVVVAGRVDEEVKRKVDRIITRDKAAFARNKVRAVGAQEYLEIAS